MSLEEKVAYQEARIRYLEDYVEFQKNAIHIGGDILIVQRQEVKDDKFYMAYDYIKEEKQNRMDTRRLRFSRCSVSAARVIMIMLHEKKTEMES